MTEGLSTHVAMDAELAAITIFSAIALLSPYINDLSATGHRSSMFEYGLPMSSVTAQQLLVYTKARHPLCLAAWTTCRVPSILMTLINCSSRRAYLVTWSVSSALAPGVVCGQNRGESNLSELAAKPSLERVAEENGTYLSPKVGTMPAV
jgi:hypothetical protein